MDFMTAYATAGHISNLLKEVVGIDKAVNAPSSRSRLPTLAAVSDLKLALIEAKDELAAKDAEIERLQKLLQRKAELIEHGGFSYDKGKDGKPKGDAYCPVCMAKDELLIHLIRPAHAPHRAAAQTQAARRYTPSRDLNTASSAFVSFLSSLAQWLIETQIELPHQQRHALYPELSPSLRTARLAQQ